MNWTITTDVVLYLTAGAILGAFYFGLLLWTIRLHASQTTVIHIIPLYFVRLAAAVFAFWIIAQQGALPLLLALLGFLISRTATQRWMRLA